MKAGNADGESNYTEYYPMWQSPTGIENVHTSPSALHPSPSTLYNLSGQRVDDNYKGIVIRNGKKFVMQ